MLVVCISFSRSPLLKGINTGRERLTYERGQREKCEKIQSGIRINMTKMLKRIGSKQKQKTSEVSFI